MPSKLKGEPMLSGLPDKFVDILAHIPFLLVTYDCNEAGEKVQHKVGFNVTRLIELVLAIVVIIYFLSKQVSGLQSSLDLIAQKAELERTQQAALMKDMHDRLHMIEERVYEHVIIDRRK